jgi:hypothetical protein
MKVIVIVTGIAVKTGDTDKAAFTLQSQERFVFLSINESKNWAMIGDWFELELTNVNK